MKASRLVFALLLASSVAVVQLAAQQTKADQRWIQEVKAKAEAGDAESQVELGLRYAKGKGLAQDQVEAVKWFRKAGRMWMMPGSCGQPIRNESRNFNEDRGGQTTTGDENFAVMLKQQSPEFREQIRERFFDYYNPVNFKTEADIKRCFPKTYKLLFGP
jgi:hypothetical protein